MRERLHPSSADPPRRSAPARKPPDAPPPPIRNVRVSPLDHAGAEREADEASAMALDRAPDAGSSAPPGTSTGNRIDHDVRAFGRAYGRDLDGVRIRADAAAATMTARYGAAAVTRGDEVFLDSTAYTANARDGARLLGHELAHVVQQRRSGVRVQAKPSSKGPFQVWGTPLPGLGVPVHKDAVSGIHEWDSKYATPTSAASHNVFYTGPFTLSQITTADDQGRPRVYVYFVTQEGSDDRQAVGPDMLGAFVMMYGAGLVAANSRNTDQLPGMNPVVDPRTLPAAPDAYRGYPQLYYLAPRLPVADESRTVFALDYYVMRVYLRHLPDGSRAVLYYVALNQLSEFRPEYVVGPAELDLFAKNVVMYENAAVLTYPLEPGAQPPDYVVKSQRFVAGVMEGDVERASEGTDAWIAAVKDPFWWLQVGTSYASAATPVPRPGAPTLSVVPRVAPAVEEGLAARATVAPAPAARVVGPAGGPRIVASGGGAALATAPVVAPAVEPPIPVPGRSRPVGVPGWNPSPAPVTPRPSPMSPFTGAAGLAALRAMDTDRNKGTATGTSTATAPGSATAPAPAGAQKEEEKKPGPEKLADSNIFMDRVEGGPPQRARIDATVLARPDLTLHVPISAILEATRMDPMGTQAKRLAGTPGGARILPDLDGDVTPFQADLPRMLSAKFGESDLRIALRAKERGMPLVTANRRLAAQVVDSNFPLRVRALAGVLVEFVP